MLFKRKTKFFKIVLKKEIYESLFKKNTNYKLYLIKIFFIGYIKIADKILYFPHVAG